MEFIIYAILLVCGLIMANQCARYGFFEIGLQRPINTTALGAFFISTITLLIGGLLHKNYNLQFSFLSSGNFWKLAMILFGIPLAWLLFIRCVILPRGQFNYNRAKIRISYWCSFYYKPGKELRKRGERLRNFPMAINTLSFFQKAIASQEKGVLVNSSSAYSLRDNTMIRRVTSCNRQNMVIALREMALLYRMMNLFDEAHQALNQAQSFAEDLLLSDPDNFEYLQLKSLILFRRAEAYQAQGVKKEEAKDLYRKSMAIDTLIGNNNEDIVNLLAYLC
jgi:tetratricopeptide (TPR) repeat protein